VKRQIVTRGQAADRGLVRYFTGKACVNGHLSERWTTTGNCLDCAKRTAEEFRQRVKLRRAELAAQSA